VHLALEGREQLLKEGANARVVSMSSTNLFSSQSDQYRKRILFTGMPLLIIEAGSPAGGSPLSGSESPASQSTLSARRHREQW
jgi:transketolase